MSFTHLERRFSIYKLLVMIALDYWIGVLVTSSLVRETTETESQNYGYKFGQEEETSTNPSSTLKVV